MAAKSGRRKCVVLRGKTEVAVSNEHYGVIPPILFVFLDEVFSHHRLLLIGLHVDIDHGTDWCDRPRDPGQLVDDRRGESSLLVLYVEEVDLIEVIH